MPQGMSVPGAPSIGNAGQGLAGTLAAVAALVPRVILAGADPGQDVDDAAALMLLIQRHKAGTAVLLAVTVSPANVHAANTMRIMLDYAGLFSIPVGARQANDVSQNDYFNDALSTYYGYTQTKTAYPAALTVLRTALAGAPNGSVVISCTGPIPDIYDLLQSPADGIDSRTGSALVQAKVIRFGMIAGSYTPGSATESNTNEFNFSFVDTEVQSVLSALAAMPIDIYACDGNLGQNTFTGPLDSSPIASNPIKNAYSIFQQNNGASIVDTGTRLTRASWDVIISDAVVDLGGRFTLARGAMTFSTTNNATSWTQGAGNWCFLVSSVSTAALQAYLNPIFDAFDQGTTAPNAPSFTVSEATQGYVVLTVQPQFFTSYSYSTDGQNTWTALPANATLTNLAPNTPYNIALRGSRYSLTGPTATVAYTTKPVATPTAIEQVPGAIRHFDFTTTTGMLPANVSNTVRVTSVADICGSAYPLAPDNTQGPIYLSAANGSDFGARPALRSVNGDAAGGNVTGAYARLFGTLPELASSNNFAFFLTCTVNNDRNDNGRILSFYNTGTDYNCVGGFYVQIPSSNRATINLSGNGNVGGTASLTHDQPMLLAVIVTNGQAQLWLNGATVGSPIALGTLSSATPKYCIFREVDQDASTIFGDMAENVVLSAPPTTANRQYVEGKMAWKATGDGSLLPAGHPYKSASP